MAAEHVVVVVVFDGMKLLDVAGPAEVFAEANRFGASYRLVVASVDGADDSDRRIGTRFAVTTRIDAVEFADTAIVSGGDQLVGRPIDPELVAAVQRLRSRCRRMASICTGSFISARGGSTGRPPGDHTLAVTPALGAGVSGCHGRPDAIFVRDDDVYTSAGVSAGIDLALPSSRMTTAPTWSAKSHGRLWCSSSVQAVSRSSPPPSRRSHPNDRPFERSPSRRGRTGRGPQRQSPCLTSRFEHATAHPAVPDRARHYARPLRGSDPNRRGSGGPRRRQLGGRCRTDCGLRQPRDVAQGVHRRARRLPEGVQGSVPVHRARLGLGGISIDCQELSCRGARSACV